MNYYSIVTRILYATLYARNFAYSRNPAHFKLCPIPEVHRVSYSKIVICFHLDASLLSDTSIAQPLAGGQRNSLTFQPHSVVVVVLINIKMRWPSLVHIQVVQTGTFNHLYHNLLPSFSFLLGTKIMVGRMRVNLFHSFSITALMVLHKFLLHMLIVLCCSLFGTELFYFPVVSLHAGQVYPIPVENNRNRT